MPNEPIPMHIWEPDFSEGEPALDSKLCGLCNTEHERDTYADEPEKTLEYPKNSQEPLDNPTETSDNLTVGESTQLQVTTISHQETKEAFDDAITIAQQRHYARWYDSGANAKKKGYSRTSPFYERPTADYFFYCGFDGVKFEDALLNLDDAMKQQETQTEVEERINKL